ncbi:MAG: carbohydrate ABC transporter permease [Lachnospiraceae bacterium]|jgi:putative aldouronate transport system permease protein|nr:carbohydrate ABC transporter permease [uncultured Acetatifactor sp.]MCI9221702.1 carbohydrate ABC transporter permease [Lachnospiraceae bacterium]
MIDNKSFHSRVRITIIYIIVILLGLGCLFPLLNIVAISLSGSAAVSANKVGILPVDFTLIAYDKIVSDGQFWRSFMISVIRVFLALLLNLAVTVPMAYAMTKSKKEFRARNIYMNLLIFAMLFNGGMIPTYILVRNLGMLNSIWALVLPGALPIFNVILLMNFFLGIPKSLEEAALIDGASPFQVLLKIMIPCAKPCLATVSLFSIVGSWNDFFSGLIYMQKLEDYPIMTYIQSLNVDIQQLLKSGASSSTLENVTELSNRNLNAAKIVVAVIPLLMIYPILQKYLITGMVMGSVKE